jgi:hypothetical protein
VRTFAQALYFQELARVVGPEKATTGDEQRCLGLFMLALWHAAAPIPPEQLCVVRAPARGARRAPRLRACARRRKRGCDSRRVVVGSVCARTCVQQAN